MTNGSPRPTHDTAWTGTGTDPTTHTYSGVRSWSGTQSEVESQPTSAAPLAGEFLPLRYRLRKGTCGTYEVTAITIPLVLCRLHRRQRDPEVAVCTGTGRPEKGRSQVRALTKAMRQRWIARNNPCGETDTKPSLAPAGTSHSQSWNITNHCGCIPRTRRCICQTCSRHLRCLNDEQFSQTNQGDIYSAVTKWLAMFLVESVQLIGSIKTHAVAHFCGVCAVFATPHYVGLAINSTS